jgi:hypothetical protein
VEAFTRLKRASKMSCPNAQHSLSTTCTHDHDGSHAMYCELGMLSQGDRKIEGPDG